MIYVEDEIKKYLLPPQPLKNVSRHYFEQFMRLKGECFRAKEGRMTKRLHLGKNTYFIKKFYGVGWKEIFKNILQLRLPVISAKTEWRAINKIRSLGISVPEVVAFGQHGFNPAKMKSFIVMKELISTTSLEDLCKNWRQTAPSFAFKLALIKEIARIARALHSNGVNHRDFYICHFLLENSDTYSANIKLHIIDLHRAQIRRKTPTRWIVKDLAGLLFSCKELGLTKRDSLRFMQIYQAKPIRDILKYEKNFLLRIEKRANKLYNSS